MVLSSSPPNARCAAHAARLGMILKYVNQAALSHFHPGSRFKIPVCFYYETNFITEFSIRPRRSSMFYYLFFKYSSRNFHSLHPSPIHVRLLILLLLLLPALLPSTSSSKHYHSASFWQWPPLETMFCRTCEQFPSACPYICLTHLHTLHVCPSSTLLRLSQTPLKPFRNPAKPVPPSTDG